MKHPDRDSPHDLAPLLASLNVLVLTPGPSEGGPAFTVVGRPPNWLLRLGKAADPALEAGSGVDPADWFPFLESFLPMARAAWAARPFPQPPPRSGWWTETAADGSPLELEAEAHQAGEQSYLVVRLLQTEFHERSRLLQKARELSLSYERLMAETSKKEVLLHCIIHDLSGPLSGMRGCLEMLEQESLSDQGKRFLRLGILEADKQRNFIRDLLDVFSMEVQALEGGLPEGAPAPDLREVLDHVTQGLAPAYEIKRIQLLQDAPPDLPRPCPVRGESSRLERILYNLLQNALQHAPRQSAVRVKVRLEDDTLTLAVEDEGPGVPPEMVPRLFQKFVRHQGGPGKAGLGLFFCRITVERWGGTIRYERRSPRGSSFLITLPRGG